MKLYTRRGDDGSTDLFGGKRVGKDNLRVHAYGTVDELNNAIGLALSASDYELFKSILSGVQNCLFDLGAQLANVNEDGCAEVRVGPEQVVLLEQQIDEICEPLAPLKQFILPGGTDLASRLHLARGVCRKAERAVVALQREEHVNEHLIVYLNRLSDLLFALARRANQLAGVEDVVWRPRP